ncbi:MAG TPA: DUF4124 domain-containing protein [Burkholderiales bacterium]|nr:DUF4124 domain-containing protein [Burkholderiales bacterium]
MRAVRTFAWQMGRMILIPAAMVLAWTPAAAQVVYKLTDKDGRTVYSDHVIPGMRVIGKLAPPPQPDPELVAAAQAAQAERAARADAYAAKRVRALDAADTRIRRAEQQLAAAKQALEAGVEPLPGERLGTVRGGKQGQSFTRFSDDYWERISELERAVSKATRELEQAYSERNALRD